MPNDRKTPASSHAARWPGIAPGMRATVIAAQFRFAPVRAPELREREEEPLLGREAVDALTLGGSFASAR